MKGILSIENAFSTGEKGCYSLSIILKKGILRTNDYIIIEGKRVFKILDIELHFLMEDKSALIKVIELSGNTEISYSFGEEYYFESDNNMSE